MLGPTDAREPDARSTPTLLGTRVTLRPPREQDRADRLACPRSAEAVRMYGGDYRNLKPVTVEEVDQWYQRHCTEPLWWMIEAEGRCVGNARLSRFDAENRQARYSVGMFDPTVWNRGYGTEVTRLVLRYAFAELHLHRVELIVLEYNHRAIAVYKKCGFVQEGVTRESCLVAGEWFSDVQMGILEHEYRAALPQWNLSGSR